MTQDIFNTIATSWYNFRHRTIFKHELERLAKRWEGGRLLNVGCAHGPDFVPFKDSFELHGVDFSSSMLELCLKYAKKFKLTVNPIEADARSLPYADETFDHGIAVATYHHISDIDGRLQAFKELHRVLKVDGEAFITVWNRWQPRFWFKPKDIMVPWRSKDRTLYRYYYLFSFRELESIVREAGFEVLESFPESRYSFPVKHFSRNVCVLVRKPKPLWRPDSPTLPETDIPMGH